MKRYIKSDYSNSTRNIGNNHRRASLYSSIKLGGGMSLPFDRNYCIFVNSYEGVTYVVEVNSKREFSMCENQYGKFVGVGSSIDDAKRRISWFDGPAKDNEVVII